MLSGIVYGNGEIAGMVKKEYEYVLVDEYQDTNPVQEAILSLVSREQGNLFMVGDIKQSIYRFRLAQPQIFLDKYKRFSSPGSEGNKKGPGIRINLSKNFRSREEVIRSVNFLFERLMTEEVAEIDYSEEHRLVPGAFYHNRGLEYVPEICLLEREFSLEAGADPEEEDDNLDSEEIFEAIEKEALLVAEKIKSLVSSKNPLMIKTGESLRACQYKDIVVLLRAARIRSDAVADIFRRSGIPSYADSGTGYFQAREVEVMLALLKVIDNPRQDIPLAAVLRSPIAGLTPFEMAVLRIRRKDGDFFEAVIGSKHPVVVKFLERLDKCRTIARRAPLGELIWTILQETSYYDYVGGLPGGQHRQANLRALYDRAREFDEFGRHGLFRFLRFIEKVQEHDVHHGAARALGEQENVVRIMSVHKAKGLEFPVVFLIDLGREFNLEDIKGDILFDWTLGIAPMYCDVPKRLKYPTLAYQAILEKIRKENIAEEMRILYVALTRPKKSCTWSVQSGNLIKLWKNGKRDTI